MTQSKLIAAKNQRVRTHGFEPPFSFAQVSSWVLAVVLFITFIIALICLVRIENEQSETLFTLCILTITYLISYGSMVVYTYRVTISDPTDPTVALERAYHAQMKFEDSRNNSVSFQTKDYQFYCDICDTHVLPDTKHCQMCNRCSYDFDHHCQWVSNDIGGANYKDFIRMLTSVAATLIVQLIVVSMELTSLKKLDEAELEKRKFLLWTCIASLVLTGLFFLADAYLLIFHIYLIYNDLSTYKYIRN